MSGCKMLMLREQSSSSTADSGPSGLKPATLQEQTDQLEEDQFILILEEMLSESQARGLKYQAVLGAKHCLDKYVINTTTISSN
ncbi:Elongation factor G [Labeo rohita]|uniref:Elongation factor G n=1 Tax=Labeo rohita TaxID=84645 RepID=A0ABQ8MSF4_LABRO|nr:Elongation factor G [Labeo rohita]